ncbi:MAG: ATPase domain-containing protein [archaeon]
MVHKRYLTTKNGKKRGPYYYTTVRTKNGKIKTVYLGRKLLSEKDLQEKLKNKKKSGWWKFYKKSKQSKDRPKKTTEKIEEPKEEVQETKGKSKIKKDSPLKKSGSSKRFKNIPADETISQEETETSESEEIPEQQSPKKSKGKTRFKKILNSPLNIFKKSKKSEEELTEEVSSHIPKSKTRLSHYLKGAEEKEHLERWVEKKSEKEEYFMQKEELPPEQYYKTGVPGFDVLFHHGIPIGSSVLVAGGPGSGKTIFCLQTAINACKQGKKVLYMSFEEPETNLRQHMKDFGWNPMKYERQGLLRIKRFNTIDLARSIEALLSEAKKELLIDIDPVLIPKDFEPDFVFIDSLSAIAAAFTGEESRYRIYMEQLFRFLEKSDITSFLIAEVSEHPGSKLTKTGVEEFLADGIIILYHAMHSQKEGIRQNAIEILKMRSEGFEGKMVKMTITDKKGIIVYPDEALSLN